MGGVGVPFNVCINSRGWLPVPGWHYQIYALGGYIFVIYCRIIYFFGSRTFIHPLVLGGVEGAAEL